MKRSIKFVATVLILGYSLFGIVSCIVEDGETYSEYTENESSEPIPKPTPEEIIQSKLNKGPRLELENTWQGYNRLYTRTYDLDDHTYRIFWLGDGNDEAALIVINIEKEKLEIELMKKQIEKLDNSYE